MTELQFLNRLDVLSLLQMLPRTFASGLVNHKAFSFYYFSASPRGKQLLGLFQRLGWMRGQEPEYSYFDVKDGDGAHVFLSARELDQLPICKDARTTVFENSGMVKQLSKRFDKERLVLYLEKALAEELSQVLLHIQIASWIARSQNSIEDSRTRALAVIHLPKSPWISLIQEYAQNTNVDVRGYRWHPPAIRLPMRGVRGTIGALIRSGFKFTLSRKVSTSHPDNRISVNSLVSSNHPDRLPFMVAVPYTGKGLTLDPSQNSDLFWYPFVNLKPNQLLVYVFRNADLLDDEAHRTLNKNHIKSTVLGGSGNHATSLPVWPRTAHIRGLIHIIRSDWRQILTLIWGTLKLRSSDRWISSNMFRFVASYFYWRWFFASHEIKIHVDCSDWLRGRIASDQAIADLGGFSISYQRSYEAFPTVYRSSTCDVHFSFSSDWLENERLSRSWVFQYISDGYVHDYAFSRVEGRSRELRNKLTTHGAQFVICFLDEGSIDDGKSGPTHEICADDYRFLLENLLADPSLGLIFKPKKASTIRQRLGNVSELLDAALATGRCHIYDDGGATATGTLPCEASMSADLSIGLLVGSTAALESALAGSKVLLLDREYVPYHPLYKLGLGKVVFRDWDSIWKELSYFRRDSSLVPGFGDWSPIADSLDSFRDGKAAERMGSYIKSLCEGLSNNLPRDEIIRLAENEFSNTWGPDKITNLRITDTREPAVAKAR